MAKKYLFLNDYSEGAHPRILRALADVNLRQELGYGEDAFCLKAVELIRKKIGNRNADIHFVSGGTQANLVVLGSILKPHESVIAAASAHINVHEAGAIEATGHKIHVVNSSDGKLTTQAIQEVVNEHNNEHMVKPRVVFISNATEVGTIYNKKELKVISDVCQQNHLYLYLDGARLGSALASTKSDLNLSEISKFVDVFYIGGTKNGALLGEAIVINNPELKKEFRYHLKQHGALLAKGRVLGVQFLELFKDNLYFQLAEHANKMADNLTRGIKGMGYKFLTESSTNQIFPILPNLIIKKMEKKYGFYVWTKVDGKNSAIRLVASWATDPGAIDEFLSDLKRG